MRKALIMVMALLLIAEPVFAAIDTADKRASISVFYGVYSALPLPDSSVGNGDRAHLAFVYRAFLESALPSTGGTTSGGTFWIIRRKQR
jgi:hypothetical protein